MKEEVGILALERQDAVLPSAWARVDGKLLVKRMVSNSSTDRKHVAGLTVVLFTWSAGTVKFSGAAIRKQSKLYPNVSYWNLNRQSEDRLLRCLSVGGRVEQHSLERALKFYDLEESSLLIVSIYRLTMAKEMQLGNSCYLDVVWLNMTGYTSKDIEECVNYSTVVV